jgi:hypothetical protein
MAFPKQVIALGILCVAILLGLTMIPRTTIFTCTTFFDFKKQDKWVAFCRAMDSIIQHHTPETLQRINKWLIVNEYDPNPKTNWIKAVQERYPFIEVIQKGEADKGQAASMNIILQHIKGYTYWIHWEETWYCRRPCLDRMFPIMEQTTISQLQITQHKEKPNWLDSEIHPRVLRTLSNGVQYYQIYPAPGTDEIIKRPITKYSNECVGRWPLYSLLPSINRVRDYNIGTFTTDPKFWPFIFEWDYGRRWLQAGNTKAVLPDGPVIRDNSAHKSTYSA